LLDGFARLSFELDFPPRVQIDNGSWPCLGFASFFQPDIAFGIQIQPKNSCSSGLLLINPSDGLLHPRVNDALLDQHRSLE
jgi:hypothetical protein